MTVWEIAGVSVTAPLEGKELVKMFVKVILSDMLSLETIALWFSRIEEETATGEDMSPLECPSESVKRLVSKPRVDKSMLDRISDEL